ncbi:glycosyltransferase-like protein, family 2 [Leptospira interrogans serovar Valbuzzi str. Duyster]|uniref:glycosyltransferase family A protein n=1 Tax=Leptospira interrogans TaxID=173 RepID=UPI0002BF9B33|nr:glycosyltransferase family A protein [Leptospira interrogans]EMJ56433.1 glycosyltransferase-like protein, family 2 [Leptospira interrogans serovar Valbuzzi str. Duyster]ENO71243.1 glycosyltransferase-like protein, family 2 [Leptospira interrogans serovar Valbuzzi str. Valbuzzi]
MYNTPIVSVIIPCYNYGKYIEQAIQSILKQSYKNWEIIVVDDGSDDEYTIEKLEDLKKEYAVIKIDRSGPAVARNVGIEAAKGKFILPLDSDDTIHSDYLLEAIAAYEKKPSLGIVYCEAEFFGSMKGRWNLPKYSFPEILLDNCIFVSAVFRKSDWKEVGGFNGNMKNEWEDYDFWLSLIEKGRDVYKIPRVMFYYRRGHVSRSSRSIETYLPLYLQLFKNHKRLYTENIELLFKRHLKARELEEQFSILTKNPIIYGIVRFLVSCLKFFAK